jgi:hypothetical protein
VKQGLDFWAKLTPAKQWLGLGAMVLPSPRQEALPSPRTLSRRSKGWTESFPRDFVLPCWLDYVPAKRAKQWLWEDSIQLKGQLKGKTPFARTKSSRKGCKKPSKLSLLGCALHSPARKDSIYSHLLFWQGLGNISAQYAGDLFQNFVEEEELFFTYYLGNKFFLFTNLYISILYLQIYIFLFF